MYIVVCPLTLVSPLRDKTHWESFESRLLLVACWQLVGIIYTHVNIYLVSERLITVCRYLLLWAACTLWIGCNLGALLKHGFCMFYGGRLPMAWIGQSYRRHQVAQFTHVANVRHEEHLRIASRWHYFQWFACSQVVELTTEDWPSPSGTRATERLFGSSHSIREEQTSMCDCCFGLFHS